jgi:hypothetical protein
MAFERISRSFKDISLSFEPHPVTKDIGVLTNQNAIIRSIRNLIETIPSERFFNVNIGSGIRSSLFDFVDYASSSTIESQIKTTISNFEPRVNNVKVDVIPSPDTNTFNVTISFDIIGQEIPTQQFTFILEATR